MAASLAAELVARWAAPRVERSALTRAVCSADPLDGTKAATKVVHSAYLWADSSAVQKVAWMVVQRAERTVGCSAAQRDESRAAMTAAN